MLKDEWHCLCLQINSLHMGHTLTFRIFLLMCVSDWSCGPKFLLKEHCCYWNMLSCPLDHNIMEMLNNPPIITLDQLLFIVSLDGVAAPFFFTYVESHFGPDIIHLDLRVSEILNIPHFSNKRPMGLDAVLI